MRSLSIKFGTITRQFQEKSLSSKSSNECLTLVLSSPGLQNFDLVQINELAEVVKNFKDGKAPGLNNFPMSTAKSRLVLSVNRCCIVDLT